MFHQMPCPEDEKLGKVTRSSHTRSCRKKEIKPGDKKITGIRYYLTTIGLTWPVFQSRHARTGPV